ncbi:hypothetical protein [Fodinicola feengrottensis]|uniref:hypothetical protein n=1 Tax=Fodinicola feengrottensis TaxID=435914 RepID=UPI0013D7FCB4|nr:hypothetical protein [Fodinicola feengrottensis]
MSAVNPTLDVVDAQNGRVLYRQPLSSDYANSAGSPVSGGPEKMPAAQPARCRYPVRRCGDLLSRRAARR